VDHDVAARIIPARLCPRDVRRLRIIKPERQVEPAAAVQAVDAEQAFRRLAVALADLVADRGRAKGNLVAPQRQTIAKDRELARRLLDHDPVDLPHQRRAKRFGIGQFDRRFRLEDRQCQNDQHQDQQDQPEQAPRQPHCRSLNASFMRATASTIRGRGVAMLKRMKLSPPFPKLSPWLTAMRAPFSMRDLISSALMPVPAKSTQAR
jgi:hypothetical protein